MSHELRTPLNAIIGYSEMTHEDLLEEIITDEMTHDVDRIGKSARHLLHLINTILDISKVEAGKEAIVLKPINATSLIDEVISICRPLVERSGNRLEVDLPTESSIEIIADHKKLSQVLINVISNAAKFTQNGMIHLSVLVDQAADMVNFLIEDTGIGIPENKLALLFEPFEQIDNAYNRKYDGTGWGSLSQNGIVK